MRLSEAIRLGAMLKPQIHTGDMRGPVNVPPVFGDVLSLRTTEGTCALGAAADAGVDVMLSTPYRHPLFSVAADCPMCSCYDGRAAIYVIWHLNDSHRWTRERIADWLETVEPARHEAVTDATSADAVREDVAEPVVTIRAGHS